MNWIEVNKNIIAKTLSELSFEEILVPAKTANGFSLTVGENVVYSFQAKPTIWNMLIVDPKSIQRNGTSVENAAQFFIDAQSQLAMTDIVLSNFLEELNNSLYSEVYLHEKQLSISVKELLKFHGEKIQTYLSGHPKLLVTKGRLGWGAEEIESFGPEREEGIVFNWVALLKKSCDYSFDQGFSQKDLLSESMDEAQLEKFLKEHGHLLADYVICPVHPWQWNRFIKIQFQKEIFEKKIIFLGAYGDHYLPQISLRTFSNHSRPGKLDIKLPLSVLNTSAVRGIANKYVDISSKLSNYIENLCHSDPELKGMNVLKEKAAMALVQSDFSQIEKAPYRYKEYLGAIWRESQNSKIDKNQELALMTGALFYQDKKGESLLAQLIKESKLSEKEWIEKYFQVVVIPLYHLQAKYGVGLVAHGQNIVLKLKNSVPSGVIIKDFQGDLRLADNSVLLSDENFRECFQKLDQLPVHYLIHDLLTGHFITVLRFASAALFDDIGFSEKVFYGVGAKEIKKYLERHPVNESINLLTPKITKVLVNKVRFSIGYQDSELRPKPMIGSDLDNPLYLGLVHLEAENE